MFLVALVSPDMASAWRTEADRGPELTQSVIVLAHRSKPGETSAAEPFLAPVSLMSTTADSKGTDGGFIDEGTVTDL